MERTGKVDGCIIHQKFEEMWQRWAGTHSYTSYQYHVDGDHKKRIRSTTQLVQCKKKKSENYAGVKDSRALEQRTRDEECCLICFEHLDQGSKTELHPCKHTFHKRCIKLWLSKQNTCPLCRTRIRHFEGCKIEDRNLQDALSYYETLQCQICGSGEREDELILCDLCDAGYHIHCLNPPLASIPQGEWFCAECQRYA